MIRAEATVPSPMSVADRLESVRARIHAAEAAAGRDAGSVRLVAVSKRHPASAIREAYAAGQRDFGENYVQELAAKAKELADLPDIVWHLIGNIQSNKAKVVCTLAHVVHTVDDVHIARELGRRAALASVRLAVLIEVNAFGEAQKHGASPGDIADVVAAVEAVPALALRGLMTVPPETDDPRVARANFSTLRTLRNAHGGPAKLPELSMGMSVDLESAIAEGATLVRVGTAIFGQRALCRSARFTPRDQTSSRRRSSAIAPATPTPRSPIGCGRARWKR